MSKSMKDMLKNSVKKESKSVDEKLKSFQDKSDRFKNAESFFSENKEENKKDTTINIVKKDIFSFPLNDYKLIDENINRAINFKKIMNKSEVIRAGLKSLSKLDDNGFVEIINSVEKIKKGRK